MVINGGEGFKASVDATLPYVLLLAEAGVEGAIDREPALATGVNIAAERIVHDVVAREVGALIRRVA